MKSTTRKKHRIFDPNRHLRRKLRPKPPKRRSWDADVKPTPTLFYVGQLELDAQLNDNHHLPMQNTDPVWHQAQKEQEYYDTQVSSGLNILINNLGIDNAADAQNVQVARTELNWNVPEEPFVTPTTGPTNPQEPDPHFSQRSDPANSYSQPLGNEKMWWETGGVNADHLKPFTEEDLGPEPLRGDPMGFGKKMP